MSDSDPETGSDEVDADEAAAAANAEDPTDEYGGLMFRWHDRKGRGAGFALAFFVGVALLVHAVGFYMFQVNAPSSARGEAHSAKVTMLDPNDGATAALLREVDDRLVFLRPASLGTGSRLRIEDLSVTFEPSFLEGRVEFRPPAVESEKEQLLAELLPKDGLVLPPVAKSRVEASGTLEAETERSNGGSTNRSGITVYYSAAGRIWGPGVEGVESLDEAVGFFDRQKSKGSIDVVIAKHPYSAEEVDKLTEELQSYFEARGYQDVSIRRATGGGAVTISQPETTDP